jgi:putative oxidoreductase
MVLGLLTRIAAFGLLALMVVAPFANHLYPRFFMNWSGTRGGEGYEYHLLAVALLLGLMVRGGGAWSLDRLLASSRDSGRKVS